MPEPNGACTLVPSIIRNMRALLSIYLLTAACGVKMQGKETAIPEDADMEFGQVKAYLGEEALLSKMSKESPERVEELAQKLTRMFEEYHEGQRARIPYSDDYERKNDSVWPRPLGADKYNQSKMPIYSGQCSDEDREMFRWQGQRIGRTYEYPFQIIEIGRCIWRNFYYWTEDDKFFFPHRFSNCLQNEWWYKTNGPGSSSYALTAPCADCLAGVAFRSFYYHTVPCQQACRKKHVACCPHDFPAPGDVDEQTGQPFFINGEHPCDLRGDATKHSDYYEKYPPENIWDNRTVIFWVQDSARCPGSDALITGRMKECSPECMECRNGVGTGHHGAATEHCIGMAWDFVCTGDETPTWLTETAETSEATDGASTDDAVVIATVNKILER